MAAPRVTEKWRPPLSWIVIAVLLAVLTLPAAVVIGFRALDRTADQMGPIEIIAVGVTLVLTLITGAVFSRTITGPINALIARTEEIGRGGRAAITAPEQHGTRELAVLSQSFLDLAERLVERTDYVNSFAVHVSHELKSPLTSIRGSAELLLDVEMSAEDRKRFLTHIIADADRLAALLERLRDLARADVPLDAKGITLAQAAEQLQLKHPTLTVAATGETGTPAALSMEAFAIILGHLADNAVQHGAGRLDLSASRLGNALRIVLADNGRGISPGNRAKVFEPFFTTRREAGGTGMGLQIARSMLEAHGGRIALLPSEAGASFELIVPLLRAA
jgi:two-component system, OmpR family, sensor kinase